jgi:hypothetical protein
VYSRTAESYLRYGGAIFVSLAAPLLVGKELRPGQRVRPREPTRGRQCVSPVKK